MEEVDEGLYDDDDVLAPPMTEQRDAPQQYDTARSNHTSHHHDDRHNGDDADGSHDLTAATNGDSGGSRDDPGDARGHSPDPTRSPTRRPSSSPRRHDSAHYPASPPRADDSPRGSDASPSSRRDPPSLSVRVLSSSAIASVPLNNPDGLDDSSLLFLRLRKVSFSATAAEVLAHVHPLVPVTLYCHPGPYGRATGEWYMAFAAGTHVSDMMAVDARTLHDRHVEAYESSKAEERYAYRRSRREEGRKERADSEVIRLQGLPFYVRELAVERWLTAGGISVVEGGIHMLGDVNGRPNGTCLVEVPSEEDVEAALKLHRRGFGNRFIEVCPQTPQEFADAVSAEPSAAKKTTQPRVMRRPPGSTPPPTVRSASIPSYATASTVLYAASAPLPLPPVALPPPLPRPPAVSYSLSSTSGGRVSVAEVYDCLKMDDIPSDATDEELSLFFSAVRVVPVRLHRKLRGDTAYIEFSSEAEAEMAYGLRRELLRGRRIMLSPLSYDDVAYIVGLPPRIKASRSGSGSSRWDVKAAVREREPYSPPRGSRDSERYVRSPRGRYSDGGAGPTSRDRGRSPARYDDDAEQRSSRGASRADYAARTAYAAADYYVAPASVPVASSTAFRDAGRASEGYWEGSRDSYGGGASGSSGGRSTRWS